MDLDCGLPQGSSLGRLKWIIYAAELQDIVSHHGISFHGFADDPQLSKSMFVSDIQTGKRAMLCCIADIEAWCQYRGLKLNADKSEVLWFGSRRQIAKLSPVDKDLVLALSTIVTRCLPTPPSRSDNGYNASRTAPRVSSVHSQLTHELRPFDEAYTGCQWRNGSCTNCVC